MKDVGFLRFKKSPNWVWPQISCLLVPSNKIVCSNHYWFAKQNILSPHTLCYIIATDNGHHLPNYRLNEKRHKHLRAFKILPENMVQTFRPALNLFLMDFQCICTLSKHVRTAKAFYLFSWCHRFRISKLLMSQSDVDPYTWKETTLHTSCDNLTSISFTLTHSHIQTEKEASMITENCFIDDDNKAKI